MSSSILQRREPLENRHCRQINSRDTIKGVEVLRTHLVVSPELMTYWVNVSRIVFRLNRIELRASLESPQKILPYKPSSFALLEVQTHPTRDDDINGRCSCKRHVNCPLKMVFSHDERQKEAQYQPLLL